MKHLLIVFILLVFGPFKTTAQYNWAVVPCSKMSALDAVNRMWVDSVHNEIILYSMWGSTICNTPYKGLFAYNGTGFHSLDKGINTHNINPVAAGDLVTDCISYENKTLFGGSFLSVGSNTLFSKSIALWNGTVWDTFPKHVFSNLPNYSGGRICGFLKHNNKLLIYGGFDTVGTLVNKNIVSFDGNTFSAVPPIPVSEPAYIGKMIAYKNKLIAAGNFYDYPSWSYYKLAQFDGTSWSEMGGGVRGGLSACQDMAVYKDTLYIAGAFPKSAGNAGNYIMKWDGTQLMDAGFGEFCGYGAIWKLIPYRNRLYAFGGFECAAGQRAFGVAYYENGTWTVPQDSLNNITSAVLYNDAIYIGGRFNGLNGDTVPQFFAKLLCPDFDAASGCLSGIKKTSQDLTVSVFPNPATSKVTIRVANDQQIERLTLLNALGQQLLQQDFSRPDEELDISALPPGIYILKISTLHGTGVTKLVKQ